MNLIRPLIAEIRVMSCSPPHPPPYHFVFLELPPSFIKPTWVWKGCSYPFIWAPTHPSHLTPHEALPLFVFFTVSPQFFVRPPFDQVRLKIWVLFTSAVHCRSTLLLFNLLSIMIWLPSEKSVCWSTACILLPLLFCSRHFNPFMAYLNPYICTIFYR